MAPSVLVVCCCLVCTCSFADWRVEVSFVQLFFLPRCFFQPIFLPTLPPPSPLPPPCCSFLYRVLFQCDRCIFCLLYVRGLMAGFRCCASNRGVISIQGLAAKSGSPWILQAPNLHVAIQVFKLKQRKYNRINELQTQLSLRCQSFRIFYMFSRAVIITQFTGEPRQFFLRYEDRYLNKVSRYFSSYFSHY